MHAVWIVVVVFLRREGAVSACGSFYEFEVTVPITLPPIVSAVGEWLQHCGIHAVAAKASSLVEFGVSRNAAPAVGMPLHGTSPLS